MSRSIGERDFSLHSIPASVSRVTTSSYMADLRRCAQGEVEGRGRQHSIFSGRIRRPDVAISSFQHKNSRLRVIQIKSSHFLELHQRFQVELNTRADPYLRRVTAVLIV